MQLLQARRAMGRTGQIGGRTACFDKRLRFCSENCRCRRTFAVCWLGTICSTRRRQCRAKIGPVQYKRRMAPGHSKENAVIGENGWCIPAPGVDPDREEVAIREANAAGIPVLAIAGEIQPREGIDFIVHGNLRAAETVSLYCNLVANAALLGIEAKVSGDLDWKPVSKRLTERIERLSSKETAVDLRRPLRWSFFRRSERPVSGKIFDAALDPREVALKIDDKFSASEYLVSLVHRALVTNYDRQKAATKTSTPPSRASRTLLTPRIMELFAAWARRMRLGVLSKKPILSSRGFDYEFIQELSQNVPIRIDDGTEFFDRLQNELLTFLRSGGRIGGRWGSLAVVGSNIELELAEVPPPLKSNWQRPDRIDWH